MPTPDAGRTLCHFAPGDVSRAQNSPQPMGAAGRKKDAQEIISEFEQNEKRAVHSAYDWRWLIPAWKTNNRH